VDESRKQELLSSREITEAGLLIQTAVFKATHRV
jgi:hypothetical protein